LINKLSAVVFTCGAALLCTAALAFVQPGESPLADKEMRHPGLDSEAIQTRIDELEPDLAAALERDLSVLGLDPGLALFDARGAQWATLWLARPFLPGSGVGNRLTWLELGLKSKPEAEALGEAAWDRFVAFLDDYSGQLRVDSGQLAKRVGVASDGQLIQIYGARHIDGIPVRGAAVAATVNHGNLVLFGTEHWGTIDVSTAPTLDPEAAVERLVKHVAPRKPDGYRHDPRLEIVPLGVTGPVGGGYRHRLAWVVGPEFDGLIQRYEAVVDAHTGELLAFEDTNHYGGEARNVKGGVYPVTYDGQLPDGVEIPGYPMPFADLSHAGGTDTTDSGGNVLGVAGDMTTALEGPFIRINEFCGAISETSAEGDLDLGTSPDPDCDVPPGASAGNTHAARSGFYELNRVKEMARGHWPGAGPANAWLNAQLEAQMNISQTCNAFWTGSVVQFFRETFPCANTGQIAGVFDHEFGHGLDDNGTAGTVSSPGEGIADVYAALRLDTSCVGRGFFLDGSLCGGYGDPCTPASGCTGIRDIDWANRTSGLPHDIDWVNGNPNCGSTHCRGAVYSEAIWDLIKRDLPTVYGYDSNTASEIGNRIAFLGADNVSTWYVLSAPGGCGATSGYQQFLAADDDNGDLTDGTPHMQALFDAYDRHQIACPTPVLQDSGCADAPTDAPLVTIGPSDRGALLSWDAVANAARYKIFRTDGEFQCDFGKTIVGEVTGTSFADSGLQNGREYSYVVAGFNSSDACMGPASTCAGVVPVAFLGADPTEANICAGDDAVYTVTANNPFVPPVTMSVTGEPAGTTAAFVPNPLNGPLPESTVLTIGNTAGVTAGSYLLTVTGDDGVTVFDLFLTLNAFDAPPGAPTLQQPADGATNQPPRPTFVWDAPSQAQSYTIEIATDPGFADIVDSATGLTATTYTPAVDLATNTEHFWRVRADNACDTGADSATFSFITEPVPGDCTFGTDPNLLFADDLESGAPGWTHSGPGDTWVLSSAQTHSGVAAWHATDVPTVSDQYLVSPMVGLPADEAPLSLQFWNWQEIEDSSGGCFDGAVVEISTDGGSTWIRLESELLTDPYDGPVSTCCSNPIAPDNAWCGDPQGWLESIVDLDAFANQLVQFRFRLATDSSVNREGWYIDDVAVQSCGGGEIFADGFESGDTSAWSNTVP
jgi:hypothetical protein